MGFKEKIFKQFSKPTGNLGSFVGWLLSVKNKERNSWAIEKMNIKPTYTILEIGYGPGTTLKNIAGRLTTGHISGIDHSEVMFEQANKRNSENIKNGKVKLACGSVWDLKEPKESFDLIFGSNVHFFWKNPADEFKHLTSFLKQGGKLTFVLQPRWIKTESGVKEEAEKTKRQFEEIGLKNIEVDFKPMKPVTCIFISGIK
jgi:ubiquinone/menaquinone biosynthesis C-methylase UbiE